jgi:hypothetical protein
MHSFFYYAHSTRHTPASPNKQARTYPERLETCARCSRTRSGTLRQQHLRMRKAPPQHTPSFELMELLTVSLPAQVFRGSGIEVGPLQPWPGPTPCARLLP